MNENQRTRHRTNIETIMENALQEHGINYIFQYPIRGRYGYICDFYLPENNIIIECDGEHWHLEGNNHDRKRDHALKLRGYEILRFKGVDIMTNLDSCLSKIKYYLDKGKERK